LLKFEVPVLVEVSVELSVEVSVELLVEVSVELSDEFKLSDELSDEFELTVEFPLGGNTNVVFDPLDGRMVPLAAMLPEGRGDELAIEAEPASEDGPPHDNGTDDGLINTLLEEAGIELEGSRLVEEGTGKEDDRLWRFPIAAPLASAMNIAEVKTILEIIIEGLCRDEIKELKKKMTNGTRPS